MDAAACDPVGCLTAVPACCAGRPAGTAVWASLRDVSDSAELLVVQHQDSAPPALFSDWLRAGVPTLGVCLGHRPAAAVRGRR